MMIFICFSLGLIHNSDSSTRNGNERTEYIKAISIKRALINGEKQKFLVHHNNNDDE